MCTSKEEFDLFPKLFDTYWKTYDRNDFLSRTPGISLKSMEKTSARTLMGLVNQSAKEDDDDGRSVTGASPLERLKRADFSEISQSDLPLLEQLAVQLWKAMSVRMTRKFKFMINKEKLDLRRTIRGSIGHGGDPITLKFKGKRKEKLDLLFLLDISGSMDKYSIFFLQFVYAIQSVFKRVESFVFSSKLIHITKEMKSHILARSLVAISSQVDVWSSGTRIGDCLREFNSSHGRKLSRKTIVIILSDGLDTGESEILMLELKKIKSKIKRLIWLNPLLGMKDYKPEARGMKAALPFVDVFISANTLDSLLKLEGVIANVF